MEKFCSEACIFRLGVFLTSVKSQTRDPQLKVPPGGLVLRIFTSWKNSSTSAANLASRGEHVSPRPPRLTCCEDDLNWRDRGAIFIFNTLLSSLRLEFPITDRSAALVLELMFTGDNIRSTTLKKETSAASLLLQTLARLYFTENSSKPFRQIAFSC